MEDELDYRELQIQILIATNRLNSVVSIDHFRYTELPKIEEVVNEIEELVNTLENIKNIIKKQETI